MPPLSNLSWVVPKVHEDRLGQRLSPLTSPFARSKPASPNILEVYTGGQPQVETPPPESDHLDRITLDHSTIEECKRSIRIAPSCWLLRPSVTDDIRSQQYPHYPARPPTSNDLDLSILTVVLDPPPNRHSLASASKTLQVVEYAVVFQWRGRGPEQQ